MSLIEFKKKIIKLKTLFDNESKFVKNRENSFEESLKIIKKYHIDYTFVWCGDEDEDVNISFEDHLKAITDQITILSCMKRNRKRRRDGTFKIYIPEEYGDEEDINYQIEGFQKLIEAIKIFKKNIDNITENKKERSKLKKELKKMNTAFADSLKKRIEAEGLMKNITEFDIFYRPSDCSFIDGIYIGYIYVYSEHENKYPVNVQIKRNISWKLEYDGKLDFIFLPVGFDIEKRDHMNLRNFIHNITKPENWFRVESS